MYVLKKYIVSSGKNKSLHSFVVFVCVCWYETVKSNVLSKFKLFIDIRLASIPHD